MPEQGLQEIELGAAQLDRLAAAMYLAGAGKFISGEAICVTAMRTLVNGRTRFGLAGPGGSASPDGCHDTPRISAADLDAQRIHRRPVLSGLINVYMHAV